MTAIWTNGSDYLANGDTESPLATLSKFSPVV